MVVSLVEGSGDEAAAQLALLASWGGFETGRDLAGIKHGSSVQEVCSFTRSHSFSSAVKSGSDP